MPHCNSCGKRISEKRENCIKCEKKVRKNSGRSKNRTSAPLKKKKWVWDKVKGDEIGTLLFLLGFIGFLVVIGSLPKDVAKAESLEKNFNGAEFRSYASGDTITLRGEIGSKEASDLSSYKYKYQFSDTTFLVYSNTDIGNKGDIITIECEVHEIRHHALYGYHVLEVKENFESLHTQSLVGSVVAWILMVGGVVCICKEYRARSVRTDRFDLKNTEGLGLGIMSIVLFMAFGLGFLLGIGGIFTSFRKSRNGVKYGTAGLILSIIGTILGIITFVGMFRFLLMDMAII